MTPERRGPSFGSAVAVGEMDTAVAPMGVGRDADPGAFCCVDARNALPCDVGRCHSGWASPRRVDPERLGLDQDPMTAQLAELSTIGPETSDEQLLVACRLDALAADEAYAELWRRHLPTAYGVAHRWGARNTPEDVVAEASARVFSMIREGRGPRENFRSYFLSTVRTVAIDGARRDQRAIPADDDTLDRLSGTVTDVADDAPAFDADLIREAFRALSEADQRVLWHTTVEGARPRVIAPVLGMTANGVSARAMRAREALRASYLDAYAGQLGMSAADSPECRWVITQLGAYSRGRLPKRHQGRMEAHLSECAHAAAVAGEVRAVHDRMPALLVPLIFAAGLGTEGFVSSTTIAGLAAPQAGGAAGNAPTKMVDLGSAGLRQAHSLVPAFAAALATVTAFVLGAGPSAPVSSRPAPIPRALTQSAAANPAPTPTATWIPTSRPPSTPTVVPTARPRHGTAPALVAGVPAPQAGPSVAPPGGSPSPPPAMTPETHPAPEPGSVQQRPCKPGASTQAPTAQPSQHQQTAPARRPDCPAGHGTRATPSP